MSSKTIKPRRFGNKDVNRVTLRVNHRGKFCVDYTHPKHGRRRAQTEAQELKAAMVEARQLADDLLAGTLAPGETLTLGKLFDMYLVHETPEKGKSKQGHDRRAARVFKLAWGADQEVAKLGLKEWKRFIRLRREGRLEGFGAVRSRQIQYDLQFLRATIHWAMQTKDPAGGGYLLDRDPTAGLKMPREDNPKRVVVSDEDLAALFEVADEIGWRFRLALTLAVCTGCRIGSIRRLRWEDLDLAEGRVRWPEETDKSGFERECPLASRAVRALQRLQQEQGRIGGWVFPAPKDETKPSSRNLFRDYWNRAVKLAEMEPVERRGWHSVRRWFTTAAKDMSEKDLMHLLGWKTEKMLNVYRQAEEHVQRDIVEAVGSRVVAV